MGITVYFQQTLVAFPFCSSTPGISGHLANLIFETAVVQAEFGATFCCLATAWEVDCG